MLQIHILGYTCKWYAVYHQRELGRGKVTEIMSSTNHCRAASSDVNGTKTNWGQSGKYLENKIRKSWRVGASHEARNRGKGSWNDVELKKGPRVSLI